MHRLKCLLAISTAFALVLLPRLLREGAWPSETRVALAQEADPPQGRRELPEEHRTAPVQLEEPSRPVRKAIRDLLSSDPQVAARAERALERAGPAVLPQLRYWVHRVRYEAANVDAFVDRLAAGAERTEGVAPDPIAAPIERDESIGSFFDRKLIEAKSCARRGEYHRCRQLAEALLALDANSPGAWELRRLQRQSRERMVRMQLEPRLDFEENLVEAGAQPRLEFRLINRSREKARIELVDGHLGTIQLRIERRGLAGAATSEDRHLTLRTDRSTRSIELAPGETWVQEVGLPDLRETVELLGMVGRVRTVGEFRPFRWSFEGEGQEDNLLLRTTDAECWLAPSVHARVGGSPLSHLVTSLVFGEREAFLVAGQLSVWAAESDASLNEKLIEVLIEHLESLDAERGALARAFLAEASGERFKTDADWIRWWKGRTARAAPSPTPTLTPGGAKAGASAPQEAAADAGEDEAEDAAPRASSDPRGGARLE